MCNDESNLFNKSTQSVAQSSQAYENFRSIKRCAKDDERLSERTSGEKKNERNINLSKMLAFAFISCKVDGLQRS